MATRRRSDRASCTFPSPRRPTTSPRSWPRRALRMARWSSRASRPPAGAEADTSGFRRLAPASTSRSCSTHGRAPCGDWVHALTLATGVAMAEGLHAASGLPVVIKWPNDLVMAPAGTVRGARKLAGILAEAQTEAGALDARHRRRRRQRGAGRVAAGDQLPRDVARRGAGPRRGPLGTVLGASLARLGTWLRRLRAGHAAVVRTRWQQLAVGATGATVEIAHAGGLRRGVTAGIDARRRPAGAPRRRAPSASSAAR